MLLANYYDRAHHSNTLYFFLIVRMMVQLRNQAMDPVKAQAMDLEKAQAMDLEKAQAMDLEKDLG